MGRKIAFEFLLHTNILKAQVDLKPKDSKKTAVLHVKEDLSWGIKI